MKLQREPPLHVAAHGDARVQCGYDAFVDAARWAAEYALDRCTISGAGCDRPLDVCTRYENEALEREERRQLPLVVRALGLLVPVRLCGSECNGTLRAWVTWQTSHNPFGTGRNNEGRAS